MFCWNLLLNKNEKLTHATIFLPRNENIYKGFLDHWGKKNMFITLINPYRLSDQPHCRGGPKLAVSVDVIPWEQNEPSLAERASSSSYADTSPGSL